MDDIELIIVMLIQYIKYYLHLYSNILLKYNYLKIMYYA